MTLDGAHALVTGGGTGLGRGCALALSEAGAAVTVVGRTRATLDETVALAQGLRGSVVAHVADVTDAAEIDAAVHAADARSPSASSSPRRA